MPTWLEKLKVKEVSLVDAGANRGAVSVLMKRAAKIGEDGKELYRKVLNALGLGDADVDKILKEADMPGIDEKVVKELQDKVEKMEKAQALSTSIGNISIAISKAKGKTDLEKAKRDIEQLDKNDTRVPVLLDMVNEALAKAAHHDEYSNNLAGDEKTKFESMPMKEKDAYMVKNPVKSSSPQSGASQGASSPDSDDDKMEKRLKEEIAKRAVLEGKVVAMEKRDQIQKIKAEDLKDMQGVAKLDELAEAIYKIRQSNQEGADVLVAQLKSMAAVVKKSKLFGELGSGETSGDPQTKLDSMAKALANKDAIPVAKAMARILDTPEGKELYEQISVQTVKD